MTDADIQAAIKQHDDPEHPDSLTTSDVRELLDIVEADVHAAWGEWMTSIERDDARLITDTTDVVVLATGEHAVYDDILSQLADSRAAAEYDDIAASVVNAAMHNAAERLSEYDWSASHPLVVSKPEGSRDGEAYTVAVVNSLLRRGLSPGQAWAYYGVKIAGESRNRWATRCGYSDHSAVSEAVRKAETKLDESPRLDDAPRDE